MSKSPGNQKRKSALDDISVFLESASTTEIAFSSVNIVVDIFRGVRRHSETVRGLSECESRLAIEAGLTAESELHNLVDSVKLIHRILELTGGWNCTTDGIEKDLDVLCLNPHRFAKIMTL